MEINSLDHPDLSSLDTSLSFKSGSVFKARKWLRPAEIILLNAITQILGLDQDLMLRVKGFHGMASKVLLLDTRIDLEDQDPGLKIRTGTEIQTHQLLLISNTLHQLGPMDKDFLVHLQISVMYLNTDIWILNKTPFLRKIHCQKINIPVETF